MAQECEVLVPEDFVLALLTRTTLRDKYQQFTFQDYVKSHPKLRFCPGPNCQVVVYSKEPKAKRSVCSHCKTIFCFKYVLHFYFHGICFDVVYFYLDAEWIIMHRQIVW